MSLSISESGDYFYIMEGESDLDCWPQYKSAESPCEEMIIRLCRHEQKLQSRVKDLEDFIIWMTGCGYDFCQHEYFIEQRDKLLKIANGKDDE